MNAGTWPLLNSAGRCSASCDQTGSRLRPEAGAAQRVVGVLQGLRGRRVPPDHQVGVGAQPGHVVPAADHEVVVLGRAPVDRLQRRPSARLGRVVVEPARPPEHRPHGVADGVVDLARLHPAPAVLAAGRVRCCWTSILPRQVRQDLVRRRGARRRGRPAMPDPVVAPRRTTASPGTPASAARSRGDPVPVPDQYCGSPPPQRRHARRRPARPLPSPAASRPRRRSAGPAPRRRAAAPRLAEPADAGPHHGHVAPYPSRPPARRPRPTWPRSRSAP